MNEEADFLVAAAPVVEALQQKLGRRFKVFAFFETGAEKGLGVLPAIGPERRQSPERHTLQLRFLWPEPAWMEYDHLNGQGKAERAKAFADVFMERLDAIEAWYEFELAASAQRIGEPIDIAFEVVGVGPMPGLDRNVV